MGFATFHVHNGLTLTMNAENAIAIVSDDEYSTDYSDSESDVEVQEFLDELHAAHEDLVRAQRRFNRLAGLDENGDANMPDVPAIAPVAPVSDAAAMEGVEQSEPQPPAHYFNGFLQVLGANGFYHQTRYLFTTQAAHLLCFPPP